MAGDWIKWTVGLPIKREIIEMAGKLQLDREKVACRCMTFWEWCDGNVPQDDIRPDGSALVKLSPRDDDNVAFIDALVSTPGFAKSMAAVGWIKFRNGRVELKNFGRHNGETAKTRARNAKNQKKKRQMSPTDGDILNTRDRGEGENSGSTHKGQSPEEYDAGSGLCAGLMIDLTESVIRDGAMFDRWIAAERSRSDGWVKSDDDEFFARAARSKAVADGTIRNIVGWFKDTIGNKHYDRVKAKHENAVGRKRGPPVTCTTIPNFQAPDTEGIDE